MSNITIGSIVKLRPGSEAWAFGRKIDKPFEVTNIRIVLNEDGHFHSAFLTLQGRANEVGIEEVIPAGANQQAA